MIMVRNILMVMVKFRVRVRLGLRLGLRLLLPVSMKALAYSLVSESSSIMALFLGSFTLLSLLPLGSFCPLVFLPLVAPLTCSDSDDE
jgi:hypothetical protein